MQCIVDWETVPSMSAAVLRRNRFIEVRCVGQNKPVGYVSSLAQINKGLSVYCNSGYMENFRKKLVTKMPTWTAAQTPWIAWSQLVLTVTERSSIDLMQQISADATQRLLRKRLLVIWEAASISSVWWYGAAETLAEECIGKSSLRYPCRWLLLRNLSTKIFRISRFCTVGGTRYTARRKNFMIWNQSLTSPPFRPWQKFAPEEKIWYHSCMMRGQ